MFVIQVIENAQQYREDVISTLLDLEVKIENCKDLTFVAKSRTRSVRGLEESLKYKTKLGADRFIIRLRAMIEAHQKNDKQNSSGGYVNRYRYRSRFQWAMDSQGRMKNLIVRSVDPKEWNDTVDLMAFNMNERRRRTNLAYDRKVLKILKLKDLV